MECCITVSLFFMFVFEGEGNFHQLEWIWFSSLKIFYRYLVYFCQFPLWVWVIYKTLRSRMSSSVSVAKPSMVCLCVCVCVNFGEKGLCIFVLFFIFWVLFCLAFSPFSPCPFSSSPSNFQRPLFYLPSYHLKSNVFLKTATANHVLLKVHSV